jgi:hypothetical protein
MFQSPSTQHFQLVSTLTRIREEWQEATGSSSLIEVEGNVGMLLADVINGIGLRTDEQIQVLGADLFQDMEDFLRSASHN